MAENWLNATYGLDRRTKAEVTYSLVAPEAKEIGVVALPPGNPISRPEQIVNSITDISVKIATFEPGNWKLDGSFVLPLPPAQSNMEVGWWGEHMSDENGEFQNTPIIEITFPVVQNVKRFGIAFDEPGDNYCSELEITVYNSVGDVILSERINNASAYAATSEGALNAYRVVYKLYQTNNPFRYPRVSELDFGIVVRFTGEDITSLGLVTEADPTGASFPLSQLNFFIRNNGRFDPLDPESYTQYLYRRQSFEYRHGLVMPDGSTEWAYMGAYCLQEWDTSDENVSFSAGGRTAIIENYTYYNSTLQTFTVGALIRRILDEVKLQYYIAPALDSSPLITGWFGERDYRDVLAKLAELSCCLCYENQQNTVEFTDISEASTPVTEINYENMFLQPRVKRAEYYNGINLKEYTVKQTTPDVQFDSEEIFYPAPWHDPNEPDYPYSIDLPCMVVTPDFSVFRDWFLQRKFALLQKRLSCDNTWRQDPTSQVGDSATVQLNKKGDSLNMPIVRQTVEFNGGVLRGSTRTVGDDPL